MNERVANRKRRGLRALSQGVLHLVLILGAVIFSLPFLWLVTTSLKTKDEIFRVPMTWVPDAARQWPVDWQTLFVNFTNAQQFIPFWTWLGNTLHVTMLSVVLNTLASSFVAYGFSRIRWRGRDSVFVLVLATLMLPAQVTMIPQFLIFNAVGWYNTLKPLWFPSAFGTAFHIFRLRQFMMTLPRELDEAAKIDGCGNLRIYSTITLPLIKPALAVVAVQTFQGAWNNFLGPYIYINTKDKMTMALGLQWFRTDYGSMYGEMMASTLVMTLPIIVIFFFCQRYMVQGISLTGIKA